MSAKCKLLVMISLIACSQLYSQVVTESEAGAIARNFMAGRHKAQLQCVKTEQNNGLPVYYVYSEPQAYVVVAADKRVPAILAYSYTSNYNEEELAPAAQMWLDYYSRSIASLQGVALHKRVATDPVIVKEVAPLLHSKWGQEKQYNYYCPMDDNGYNKRCVTGCVATALAQLMYYFRFPNRGVGEYGYTQEPYGEIFADFALANYDYSAMCDMPSNINAAASLLIKHIGVACDLQYGPNGTGMYNHKAAYALRHIFRYSPATEYLYRDSTTLNWDSIVALHLDKAIPLYYAGWTVPNIDGHAFVCDGYQLNSDGDYYFHFNFGWDGRSDGYFYTEALNPSGYNFNLAQEVIINAYPDTAKYAYPVQESLTGCDTLTSTEGSAGYCAGRSLPQGVNYTWYIAPASDSMSAIKLWVYAHVAAGDTLYITRADASLIAEYTDADVALNESYNAEELILHLCTHSDTSRDIHISYEASLPTYCANIQIHNTQSGTIDDGSGDKHYANYTDCRHRISVSPKTGLVFYFPTFKVAAGDTLYVYNLKTSPSELLLALSGDYSGHSFNLPVNTVMLSFQTNETITDEGWILEYYGDYADIQDAQWQNSVQIKPNAVQYGFELSISEALWQQMNNPQAEIYDVSGKCLQKIMLHSTIQAIDMSGYAAGLYFVKVGVVTKKVVKQ